MKYSPQTSIPLNQPLFRGENRLRIALVGMPGSGKSTLFQAVSGDNHPIHYDREYCRRQGHPDMLAHGFLVLIQTAAGASLMPHLAGEALIGFIEQSARFLKPVYAGDTLYPRHVVAELKPQRTTGVMTLDMTVHNQKRELVLDGWHKYLLRLGT